MTNTGSESPARGKGDPYWRSVRLIVFLPCLAITVAAWSFTESTARVARCTCLSPGDLGGLLAELAAALERRDGEREKRELSQQNAGLRDEVAGLREPSLAAAVHVGSDFVQHGRSPDSVSARYLGVSDEIRSAANANDFLPITRVLRIKFGTAGSESFLLGRQLTLLLIEKQVSEETRSMVRDRVKMRVDDDALADAVDKVLAQRRPDDDATTGDYMRYLVQLISYLGESTHTADGREARARLLLGLPGTAGQPDGDGEDPDSFEKFLKRLVDAGVHQTDPDVLLFWGVVSGDAALVEEAQRKGADPAVLDWEIRRRHREYEQGSGD